MRLSVRQVSAVITQLIRLLCEDTVLFAHGKSISMVKRGFGVIAQSLLFDSDMILIS
jgi:hypothetical protein